MGKNRSVAEIGNNGDVLDHRDVIEQYIAENIVEREKP